MNHFFYTIFYPLEWLISWIMWAFHWIFVHCGMSDGSGFAWCLSIIFLTLFVRACIFPLYTKQMRSMAKMQAIQPELRRIQNKYKGRKDPASQEAMQRETMKLYKENGSNPLGSCLPMVIQAPIFLALYDVLFGLSEIAQGKMAPIGAFSRSIASQIENTIFINVRLSALFNTATGTGKWTVGIFVFLMCATMFYMTFYNMQHNTPRSQMNGRNRRTQMGMAIGMPLLYIFSGAIAPFGVLLYWLTSNIWSVLQTIYQVNRYPTPGSIAAERKEAREHAREVARREREGLPTIEEEQLASAQAAAEERSQNGGYQRAQPMRRKSKKKGK